MGNSFSNKRGSGFAFYFCKIGRDLEKPFILGSINY